MRPTTTLIDGSRGRTPAEAARGRTPVDGRRGRTPVEVAGGRLSADAPGGRTPVGAARGRTPADDGRPVTRRLGHLLFVTLDADAHRPAGPGRRAALGPLQEPGFVAVAVPGSAAPVTPAAWAAPATPSALVARAARRPGRTAGAAGVRLLVWDTGRPYGLRPWQGADEPHGPGLPVAPPVRACLVPRAALGPWANALAAFAPLEADPASPSAALLAALVAALADTPAGCPEPIARRLADSVTDLLASLVAEHTGARTDAAEGTRGRLLEEIRAHVDRHLTDPGLGPESIAAAHHISVRSLHKLFEDEDLTVGRLVQRRRLEECAEDLLRPGNERLTIAAVARTWGFVNPAHFSRLFRSVYGVTPSRWRQGHGDPPAGPAPPAEPRVLAPSTRLHSGQTPRSAPLLR
ncbi:helix-turn-helix domain-containing protein [Streptomyces sp. NPDC006610]|uniref:helix-turn-helix domain-containing protein n=1 Tax=Streptomyces sp. NPDC006610 TaxID=3154584 RepID=UPI0033B2E07A